MRIQWIRSLRSCLYLAGLSCLAGCVSSQNTCSVHVHLVDHKPYCGGAFPTSDQLKGFVEPITGNVYRLIADTVILEFSEKGKELFFNDSGEVQMELKSGGYSLVLADKWLPVEDFMQKYSSSDPRLYRIKGRECFEKWKSSVDFSFTLSSDTSLVFIRKNHCNTFWNPCIEYIGPASP